MPTPAADRGHAVGGPAATTRRRAAAARRAPAPRRSPLRPWWIAAGAALGLLAGLAAAASLPERSAATTRVLVDPLEGNPFSPSTRGEQLVNLNSEAEAVRADAVAVAAAVRLGDPSAASDLLDDVSVEVPLNTQLLEITVAAGDDAGARRRSQAVADAFLDQRRARAQGRIDDQVGQLDEQLDAARAELATLAAQRAAAPAGSAPAALLDLQLEATAAGVDTLSARRAALAATPLDPGEVVVPAASAEASPLGPGVLLPLLGALLGALLGGSLGAVVALARTRPDGPVHDVADVESLGLAVLGTVGAVPGAAPGTREDDLRRLRNAVLARATRRPYVVLVAGADSGSAVPVLALELATAIAKSGRDTVVVDATAHGGPAATVGLRGDAGLSDVLLGEAWADRVTVPVAPLMWLVPPGADIAEVGDLLSGEAMEHLLDALGERSEAVVVAAPSAGSGTGQSLANVADAVLLEAVAGRTDATTLRRTADQLALLRADLLGVVLLGPDAAQVASFEPHTSLHRRQLPRGPAELRRP